MKHIVAAVILAFSTGAMANGAYQPRNEHRHNGYQWVAPMLGGIAIGAIIAREQYGQLPAPVYLPPVQVPPPVIISPAPRTTMCLIQVYDPYNNTYRNEPVPCIKYQ